MSRLFFNRLNQGWNAEPNAPEPQIEVEGNGIRLTFFLNPFAFPAQADEIGCLTFDHCSAWRLGPTNDEGWYRGQCRYSGSAPAWGEFYELVGSDDLRRAPVDWTLMARDEAADRHFLFYLRDDTFECFAASWMFSRGLTRPSLRV